MKLRIAGKRWRLKDTVIYGLCSPAVRLIDIDPRLKTRKRLEIVIHELLHAIWPDADEEKVTNAAKVIAKALWKDGWKRGKS